MLYELSEQEIQHIERYRDLTEDFQSALDAQMDILFRLQTELFKQMLDKK